MAILTQSTGTALWLQVVHEAETTSAIALAPDLESYLVFLLMRYIKQPELLTRAVATAFLEGLHLTPHQRNAALQGVGDQCLLLSGLYPDIAKKRQVSIGYFVNLGRTAYHGISLHDKDLYALLGQHFVTLMDVLQSIRPDSGLLPLEAYELWSETGSQRAFALLRHYSDAIPFLIKK
ncbi:MAG: hypothetical protein SFW66_04235 [Gammaproteobacteria bacterium]|nr:hypothetical protein [Gammaproteobacteria bacterium]